MKVCVDVQAAITQRAGVGRYTQELVRHLGPALRNDRLVLFCFDFTRRGRPPGAPDAEYRPVRWCPGRLAQLAWNRMNWPPFEAFAGDADVYHFPNFLLPPLRGGSSVVTIHDMSFLRYPDFAEARNLAHLTSRIEGTAQRADAVITDSRFSAEEIQTLLHVDGARVFPIPLGIADDFCAPDRETVRRTVEALGIRRPYVLTVGTLEPRKNIPFLLDVFERLPDFDGELVIAGAQGWQVAPILARMKASPRAADIRFLEYVPDSRLPALYAGADLFVCASLYEGFGFPPLEAMACGTPVVSSAAGSLREILGDGAVLLDDFDAERWAHEVGTTLSDSGRRGTLVSAGRERAALYTWAETARRTAEVYRKVAR